MLTLLDDDSSSESEAGDIDDLLSSHEDLLSKCPTYEVRARSRPSHASTLPLTPFPHAQYVPNALAGPHGRKSRLAPHDAALPALSPGLDTYLDTKPRHRLDTSTPHANSTNSTPDNTPRHPSTPLDTI